MKMEEKGRKESKARDNKQDEGRNRYVYELNCFCLVTNTINATAVCILQRMGRCAFKGDPSSPSTALSVLERTSIVARDNDSP